MFTANVSVLQIPRVTSQESGNYSCSANNTIGIASRSMEVIVYGKLTFNHIMQSKRLTVYFSDYQKSNKKVLTAIPCTLAALLVVCLSVLVSKIRKVRKVNIKLFLEKSQFLITVIIYFRSNE